MWHVNVVSRRARLACITVGCIVPSSPVVVFMSSLRKLADIVMRGMGRSMTAISCIMLDKASLNSFLKLSPHCPTLCASSMQNREGRDDPSSPTLQSVSAMVMSW